MFPIENADRPDRLETCLALAIPVLGFILLSIYPFVRDVQPVWAVSTDRPLLYYSHPSIYLLRDDFSLLLSPQKVLRKISKAAELILFCVHNPLGDESIRIPGSINTPAYRIKTKNALKAILAGRGNEASFNSLLMKKEKTLKLHASEQKHIAMRIIDHVAPTELGRQHPCKSINDGWRCD
jgi:hypothetical protein